MGNISVGIVGTGMCVPEKILTSAELAGILNVSEEWIETMSGIRQRHIAAPGQSASDLGLVAAQQALDRAGIAAAELDLIIVATVTPDMQCPSTACLIGQRLGLPGVPAFEILREMTSSAVWLALRPESAFPIATVKPIAGLLWCRTQARR